MKIHGIIKDAATGEPLAGAKVTLTVGETELATLGTNAKGKFEHTQEEELTGETLVATVELAGYIAQEVSRRLTVKGATLNLKLLPIEGELPMWKKKWPILAGAGAALILGLNVYLVIATMQMNRRIPIATHVATGLGPNDNTDNGQIRSRVLNFTKRHDETSLRIVYNDNLRLKGGSIASRWEIRIDGQSLPASEGIYQDKFIYNASGHAINSYDPGIIMAYAVGVSKGEHQLQVWVGPPPGYSTNDASTGWNNSRWTLEVEEVWLPDDRFHQP